MKLAKRSVIASGRARVQKDLVGFHLDFSLRLSSPIAGLLHLLCHKECKHVLSIARRVVPTCVADHWDCRRAT